jgi:hypothetical protein
MKTCLTLSSCLLVAMTLSSCNSPGGQSILNNTIGVPVRMLQALGRTAGMVAQNDQPAADSDAVAARGRQIQQQGPHGTMSPAARGTAVVQR